eukprot:TRINITY_DN6229_c0_g1_i1.p1 TRINITY_DN6229_c0_g1~~TRINITY_DN6229_c0_g1_i1.p1  ORF type:complete len:1080 (+),score=172.82 TRINITY_DN6229_c0_g1_i1:87-3326(+)
MRKRNGLAVRPIAQPCPAQQVASLDELLARATLLVPTDNTSTIKSLLDAPVLRDNLLAQLRMLADAVLMASGALPTFEQPEPLLDMLARLANRTSDFSSKQVNNAAEQQRVDELESMLRSTKAERAELAFQVEKLQGRLTYLEELNRLAAATHEFTAHLEKPAKGSQTEEHWLDDIVHESILSKCAEEHLCPQCNCHLGPKAASVAPSRVSANQTYSIVEPPLGEVAIVFTDIPSSALLWNLDWGNMRRAVALHNALSRRLIAQHSGYEVKTEQDAFMVVFADSLSALRFCVDFQLELMATEWPRELFDVPGAEALVGANHSALWRGLRVRMGIHVGEPLCDRDPATTRMDYHGSVVNKAARVAGNGLPGEIIMSAAMYRRVSEFLLDGGTEDVPPGVTITELNHVVLKGFEATGPEPLYQILPIPLRGRETTLRSREVDEDDIPMITEFIEDKIAPPTGLVAIVFVDVPASSFLWSNASLSVVSKSVAKYKACLRGALREFRGCEAKCEAEAFMMVFGHALDALRWCLHVQKALLELDWPRDLQNYSVAATVRKEAGPNESIEVSASASALLGMGVDDSWESSEFIWRGLRTRMGVHTGTVVTETNPSTGQLQYEGLPVGVAANVASASHGGEILCTRQVADSVRSHVHSLLAGDRVIINAIGRRFGQDLFRVLPQSLEARVKQFDTVGANSTAIGSGGPSDIHNAPSKLRMDYGWSTQQERARLEELEKRDAALMKERESEHTEFMRRIEGSQNYLDPAEQKRKLLKWLRQRELRRMMCEDTTLPEIEALSAAALAQDRRLLQVEIDAALHTAVKVHFAAKQTRLKERLSARASMDASKSGSRAGMRGKRALTRQMEAKAHEELFAGYHKLKRFLVLIEDFTENKALPGESPGDAFMRQWLVECDSRCFISNPLIQHQVGLLLANTDPAVRQDMFSKITYEFMTPKDEERAKTDTLLLRRSFVGMLAKIFTRFSALKHQRDWARKRFTSKMEPASGKRRASQLLDTSVGMAIESQIEGGVPRAPRPPGQVQGDRGSRRPTLAAGTSGGPRGLPSLIADKTASPSHRGQHTARLPSLA